MREDFFWRLLGARKEAPALAKVEGEKELPSRERYKPEGRMEPIREASALTL